MIRSVEVEFKFGQLGIIIEDIFLMIRDKDMGKCIGLMAHTTKECGIQDNKMEKENM